MKCTRSQASAGLIESANEGIGVPFRPPTNTRYMLGPLSPHLMWPSVRSYGTMGVPQSSVRSSADGPSPSAPSPWHCAQLNFTYMAAPRSTDLGVYGGSGGILIVGSGFSVAKRGEKVLM